MHRSAKLTVIGAIPSVSLATKSATGVARAASSIPGLFVAGEANFSDHGANRLGASALMQGLADGYFVLPVTIGERQLGSVSLAVPE